MLSRRALVVLFFLFATAVLTKAQTSVYVGIDLTNYGYATSANGNFTYSPGAGNFSYYKDGVGFSGGGTYLFSSRSRLKAGVDLRGMYSPGSTGGAGSFASLRIAFVPRSHALSPYFQIGGGFLTTVYASEVLYGNGYTINAVNQRERIYSGAADFNFGVNVRTSSNFSIRAIELGGYAGSNISHAALGAGILYNLSGHGTQRQ